MTTPELKTPEWLTTDFLQKAIKTFKNDNSIEILKFEVSTGFEGHFASSMFRCSINFKGKTGLDSINVMVKAKPVDEPMKMDIIAGGPLFETETRMYKKILPAIHQLYERNGQKVKFAPELIYATETPIPIIILRDMSDDGFSAPHQPPEKLEDSKSIIKRLAQFHAGSFVLSENNELDFSDLDYTVYGNDRLADIFFNDTLECFKEVLETWEDSKQYLPNFEHLQKNICELTRKSFTMNQPGQGYNILNHGDFHNRNLLFKQDENGNLVDFYFIDFQTCIYSSPAVDVSYMMGLVRRDESGEIPDVELIMFYHKEFVNAVKSLGYLKSVPTLLDLNLELLRNGTVGMLLSIFFIPYAFVDFTKINPKDMVGDGSEGSRKFKKSLYEHPMCKKLLQKEIKKWVGKGWI